MSSNRLSWQITRSRAPLQPRGGLFENVLRKISEHRFFKSESVSVIVYRIELRQGAGSLSLPEEFRSALQTADILLKNLMGEFHFVVPVQPHERVLAKAENFQKF